VTNWRSVILRPDNSIREAIQVLDRESLRIVLVADECNRLLGTVTDGDIRRALIRSHEFETHLSEVMFCNPTVASIEDDHESILSLMTSNDLLQVPILNKDGSIVGLETLHHLLGNRKKDNMVFLMAGGFGKRLRPLTDNIPKPLLHVGSKPILETILEQFVEAGFYNFFISTHFRAEMVRDHFGDGSKWGITIQYIYEDKPLGTAGAFGLLPSTPSELPLIVMNGDLLTKINFNHLLDFHYEQGGGATMCVRDYTFQVPYGVIEAKGQMITKISEKPAYKFFVNAGIYVLNPSLVTSVQRDEYLDMPSLLEQQIAERKQVDMFPIYEYWLDIGQVKEYEQANREISE